MPSLSSLTDWPWLVTVVVLALGIVMVERLHQVVVHPVRDRATEHVAADERRAVVETGPDARAVHGLDDLLEAVVVTGHAGEAGARHVDVDRITEIVLQRGDT